MDKTRVTLKPTLAELHMGDPHLPEMIRFIRFLVDRGNEHEVAKNAALAYLALITAFQEAGLVEPEWVPVLCIDVGEVEYELCVDQARSVMNIDQEVYTTSTQSERALPARGSSSSDEGEDRALTPAKPKVTTLLDNLLVRLNNDLALPNPVSIVDQSSGLLAGASCPATIIGERLGELDALDRQAQKVSVAINLCYHSIGEAYRSFAKTYERSSAPISHNRALQGRIFEALWSTLPHGSADTAARARLQKRLQRARKYLYLVDVLGVRILYLAPEISISRVDLLRLGDLQKIASGSLERRKVLDIKERFGHVETVVGGRSSAALQPFLFSSQTE